MKLTMLFLLCLGFCIPAHAQNDPTPIVEFSRTAAFAEANSAGSGLVTSLVAGDLTPEEFGEALLPMAEDFYVTGFISLTQAEINLLKLMIAWSSKEVFVCRAAPPAMRFVRIVMRSALRPLTFKLSPTTLRPVCRPELSWPGPVLCSRHLGNFRDTRGHTHR